MDLAVVGGQSLRRAFNLLQTACRARLLAVACCRLDAIRHQGPRAPQPSASGLLQSQWFMLHEAEVLLVAVERFWLGRP